MAFNVSTLQRKTANKPAICLFHGLAGVGKTTLALGAPSPVLIAAEDGLGMLDAPMWSPTTFAEAMEAIASLTTEEHDFKSVVIDSVDWLEPLVWKAVCDKNSWANIESPGYGKGYKEVDLFWQYYVSCIRQLRDVRGMNVIQIAHSVVKPHRPPDGDPYDRYVLKLQERASAIIAEYCDVIGFVQTQSVTTEKDAGLNRKVVRAVGTGRRFVHVNAGDPAWLAKNRYSMPNEIELPAFGPDEPAYTKAPEIWASVAQWFPTNR